MERTFRIGRVAGIEIDLHWTWLLAFALFAWALGTSGFPSTNPGLAGRTYAAMAVVATLVFFVCLLLHELGHALVARREQVEIDGITLWLFGGVARLRGELPSPGAELRIALAGPAVTLVLGAAFIGAAAGLELPSALDGVLSWLGYVNVSLLVFNLIPAFPLDGGRALRAIFWGRSLDLADASRRAVRVSRSIALAMIAWGVVVALAGSALAGVWLAAIGWFVLGAGRAEAEGAATHDRLAGLRARDLMEPRPACVGPDLPLDRFVDEVAWRHRYPTYPVVEADGAPAGLLAFQSLATVPRDGWPLHVVADCMAPLDDVPQLAPDLPAGEALAIVAASPLQRALVVEGGRLAGLLTIHDLARALQLGPPHPPSLTPETAATTVGSPGGV